MPTLTEKQIIRNNLGDPLKKTVDKDKGDGDTKIYILSHQHVQDVTVWVDGDLQVLDTDFTIDSENGQIEFTTPPATDEDVRVEYSFAGFSDLDLDSMLGTYGTPGAVTVQAIKMLMADAARRFDYTHGQSSMNPSQIFDHLKELLAIHTKSNSNTPLIVDRINPYYAGTKEQRVDLSRADLGL